MATLSPFLAFGQGEELLYFSFYIAFKISAADARSRDLRDIQFGILSHFELILIAT
jgi:hypothetical protein